MKAYQLILLSFASGLLGAGCLALHARAADAVNAGQEQTAPADEHAADEHAADGHAADGHAAAAETPNPLAFDPDLAIFTAVVFLILVGILGKFAWPTIAASLDERERNIANHIAAAEAKHDEAKQLLSNHEAKLAGAADEVRELLEEARRDAETTKQQIVAEAKKAADDERKRAVREVEQAKDAALHELADRTANTAVNLAESVLRQQITSDRQAEIVRDALGKLTAAEPSKN